MAQQVIAEGLTALDWVRAGAVLLAGVLLGRGVRWLLVRRWSQDDGEARAAVMVVGRLIGSVAVLGGLVYALAILQVRLGPCWEPSALAALPSPSPPRACWPTSSPASSCRHGGPFAAATRSSPATRRVRSRT
jgi:hypothetical protein